MNDLNEMAIFAIVVGTGSFTRAAEKLKLPKSTVSRKISQLEQRVGVRLINRTTRNLKPTEVGKLYYDHCVRLVEQAEEADRVVNNMQAEPSGKLRISTPLSFGTPFMMRHIRSFLEKYPRVDIEVVSDNKIVDMLEEEIDIAMRIGPLSDSSLVTRNLGSARLALVASPDYIARHGVPGTIEELTQHCCVSHPATTWQFRSGQGVREIKISPRMVSNDMDMIRKMALSGFGIGAAPQILVFDDVEAGRLVHLLPDSICRADVLSGLSEPARAALQGGRLHRTLHRRVAASAAVGADFGGVQGQWRRDPDR
jgi:DNA-binding transcriptional LysR family regulator